MELTELLAEQRHALAASCENYDKGNTWEAPRLATTVFTLLHDGGSITSLLTQLGLRTSLRFISSARVVEDPPGTKSFASPPLLKMEMRAGTGARFVPRFAEAHSSGRLELQFPRWWQKEAIYKDERSGNLSRRRLVFALRHQDGGGHIGELTDPSYVKFKDGGGWFGGLGDGSAAPMKDAIPATMRQIAWELTETLKQLGEVV
jgi:hypothetical protein